MNNNLKTNSVPKVSAQVKQLVSLRRWIEREIKFDKRMGDEYVAMEEKLQEPDYRVSTVHFQKAVTLEKTMQKMKKLGLWKVS